MVDALYMFAFQFYKVRLKPALLTCIMAYLIISILQSSIKTLVRLLRGCRFFISILQSSIKTGFSPSPCKCSQISILQSSIKTMIQAKVTEAQKDFNSTKFD